MMARSFKPLLTPNAKRVLYTLVPKDEHGEVDVGKTRNFAQIFSIIVMVRFLVYLLPFEVWDLWPFNWALQGSTHPQLIILLGFFIDSFNRKHSFLLISAPLVLRSFTD